MARKKCPVCGCMKFYVIDPVDEYEIFEFECEEDEIVFNPEIDESEKPEIEDETETFCDQCAWHGKLNQLNR